MGHQREVLAQLRQFIHPLRGRIEVVITDDFHEIHFGLPLEQLVAKRFTVSQPGTQPREIREEVGDFSLAAHVRLANPAGHADTPTERVFSGIHG